MRKPTGKLETELSDGQQAQLADWLLSGMKYHEAVPVVEKEFGLKVGHSAFQAFWEHVCVPVLLRRRSVAVSTAEEIAGEAKARPGQFDQATVDALKQKAFELSISPNANPKNVKALFMLVLKARDQDQKDAELALAREKFQFDAAKACLKQLPALKAIASDSKLDEQSKLRAVREKLFGALPE